MVLTTLCRLCICPFHDCKQLFDDSGQCNDVYDVASKYFDRTLLNPGEEFSSPVICTECWQHIIDFYNFQQSVYTAQLKLKDVKHVVPVVKQEEELILDETPFADNENPNNVTNNEELLQEDLKDEIHMSESDVNAFDERDQNPFSSDDDKTLVQTLKVSMKKRIVKNKLKKQESIKTEKKITSSKKRVKKLKTDKPKISKDLNLELQPGPSEDANLSSNNETDKPIANTTTNEKSNIKQKIIENDALIAAWKGELDCEVCHSSYPNYSALRKHFFQEHPDETFYILCCQRKFKIKRHILEHIRLHMNPNAFKCEICSKCSTNSRNLAKHIKEMHTESGKERPFECQDCKKSFANKTILRTHMETHATNLNYICNECGKGFSTEQRRNLHVRSVHQADRVCDQCGKTLHGPYALKKHLLEHAGIQRPKWPCDQCGIEVLSLSTLKQHKTIAHHDGSTVYVCSECGKVATSEVALRSHKQKVHRTIRKFKCTICEKSFKFSHVLREHMATHTGEDLYQCPHCTKTFKTSGNFHHHRKKAHPKEWAEARMNKPHSTRVDFNLVSNEVVI